MANENTNPISGFADVFLSKLKEQSFVILIMLGVIYYQHRLMEERVAFWQAEYDKKDSEIDETVKDDKKVLMERITYLQDQRDQYAQDAINELKNNKQ